MEERRGRACGADRRAAALLALALAGCAGAGPAGEGPTPGDAAPPAQAAPREGGAAEGRPPRPGGGEEPGRPAPPAAARPPALPSIPARRGPLEIRVQYPGRHQRIAARDSNFVFGTVGTGDAGLRIDGRTVRVEPNGAFLAWLPLPARVRGDTAVYRLSAWREPGRREGPAAGAGGAAVAPDTQRVELPVLLPVVAPPGGAVPWIDTTGLARRPERWVRPGEPLELSVTGGTGLRAWIEAGGRRFDFEEEPLPGTDSLARYVVFVDAETLRRAACGPLATPGRCRGGRRALEAGIPRARTPSAREERAPFADEGRVPAGPAGRPTPVAPSPPVAELDVDSLRLRVRATPATTGAAVGSGAGIARDAAAPDTVTAELGLALAVLETDRRLEVALEEAPDPVNGRAGVVVARPTPYGAYRWRFPEGTRAAVTGRVGDRLRIRLQDGLEAWVLEEDTRWRSPSAPAAARVFDARVEPRSDRLLLRIGLERAVPAHVRQVGRRRLALVLHGAAGVTGRGAYGPADPLLQGLEWDQAPGPRIEWTVELAEPVWGWRVGYETGDARAYEGPRASGGELPSDAADPGAVLVLEIHRPPPIDRERPLQGRRIAVDPGHPEGGSRGPTGYYEGDANLAVARRLAELLEDAGAIPVLVRRDEGAVGLYERTARAVEAGAELFVSIHANALPDGVRPFGREGTSTYYHHPHALGLARAVQTGMLAEMGLADLGVVWGDLAVARLSWIPSVLAEGAFLMHPAHEAALRTPAFQERYARGVLRGLETFLRDRAAAARSAASR